MITPVDFDDNQVQALLALHLRGMHDNTPAGHVFALDCKALQQPDIDMFGVWQDQRLCAIGALHYLNEQRAELKSMRTHPDFLRQGKALQLLRFLIQQCRQKHLQWLSLETGCDASFLPAIAMYKAMGFQSGEAFGQYQQSEFNQFFHLKLV